MLGPQIPWSHSCPSWAYPWVSRCLGCLSQVFQGFKNPGVPSSKFWAPRLTACHHRLVSRPGVAQVDQMSILSVPGTGGSWSPKSSALGPWVRRFPVPRLTSCVSWTWPWVLRCLGQPHFCPEHPRASELLGSQDLDSRLPGPWVPRSPGPQIDQLSVVKLALGPSRFRSTICPS